jgi:hypothetical protein
MDDWPEEFLFNSAQDLEFQRDQLEQEAFEREMEEQGLKLKLSDSD